MCVRTYVRPSIHLSEDQVKIFVQGRISRAIMVASWYFIWEYSLWDQQEYTRVMTSWPIFHGPLTLDFGQIIMVDFVQGRISRPVNGSKLLFHLRMYIYEISRNIQEPWPPDLYFTVCWLQTLADFPWLRSCHRYCRLMSSTDGSKLIFY